MRVKCVFMRLCLKFNKVLMLSANDLDDLFTLTGLCLKLFFTPALGTLLKVIPFVYHFSNIIEAVT